MRAGTTHPTLPRDKQGWRIPRPGTKSEKIYRLLLLGKTPSEICTALHDDSYNSVAVLTWKIRHPENANTAQTIGRKR